MQAQSFGATGPDDLNTAFTAIAAQNSDALLVLADAGFYTHRRRIVDLAANSRLPSMYGFKESVTAGGFLAYGPSIPNQWNRAAYFVDRILRGAEPADLPVEQPTKFELVINMKTAKALGLTIPPSLLLRADHLIE
jgi:putative ABC transport system substrate-binding protein